MHSQKSKGYSLIICDKSFCKEHSNHIFIFDSEKESKQVQQAWQSNVLLILTFRDYCSSFPACGHEKSAHLI
jgi:hypothetical protein